LETGLAVDAPHAFVIHLPALAGEQDMQPTIAPARPLGGLRAQGIA
jgi:hypothetical protein